MLERIECGERFERLSRFFPSDFRSLLCRANQSAANSYFIHLSGPLNDDDLVSDLPFEDVPLTIGLPIDCLRKGVQPGVLC